jgi:hypothetical protein
MKRPKGWGKKSSSKNNKNKQDKIKNKNKKGGSTLLLNAEAAEALRVFEEAQDDAMESLEAILGLV